MKGALLREGALAGALPAIAAVTLLAAGCGGKDTVPAPRGASGSDVEQIEELTDRFESAVRREDAKAFCRLLAPNDVLKLGHGRTSGRRECLVVWGRKRNPLFKADESDLSIVRIVQMDTATATAKLSTGGKLTYLREGGRWHVHLAPSSPTPK